MYQRSDVVGGARDLMGSSICFRIRNGSFFLVQELFFLVKLFGLDYTPCYLLSKKIMAKIIVVKSIFYIRVVNEWKCEDSVEVWG